MTTKVQPLFQLTFVKKNSNRRPKTSSVNRSVNNASSIQKKYSQNDPVLKMKQLKAEAKKIQRQYISVLTNLKQSQKCINENYKQAQRKKVSFIKLYQTKKLKNLSSNLVSQCKTQREKYDRQSKQHARRIKLQQELKSLITKQQKQTNLENLRKHIQNEKQKFGNKKLLKNKQLYNMSRNSFLAIKQSHQDNKQRKSHIKSVSDVRSKHNYWKRVSDQIMLLEQYEKVIKDLEQFDSFHNEMEDFRAPTAQTARSSKTGFFITQKK